MGNATLTRVFLYLNRLIHVLTGYFPDLPLSYYFRSLYEYIIDQSRYRLSLSELYSSKNHVESMENLVKAINSSDPEAKTLFSDAAQYFSERNKEVEQLQHVEQQVSQINAQLESAGVSDKKDLEAKLNQASKVLTAHLNAQKKKRLERLEPVLKVCRQIIELSEGVDFDDTQTKSAKYLGSLLLSSSGQGKKLATQHQHMKPAYKAVLSLRLLDKLVADGVLTDAYITRHFDPEVRYDREHESYEAYFSAVLLPTLLAALFQDVGMQHPEVTDILTKDDNKDPYRLLEPEERQKMLQLNYQYTLLYLTEGLGCGAYIGNSKEERDDFNEAELARVKFQSILIKDAVKSKIGIGEVIKIPQIYVSVLLSTKRQYIKKELPKAAILIEQLAKTGKLKDTAASAFISIVGYFPQGYGITFIPVNLRGMEEDTYEYGIVCRLNPEKPYMPYCRQVTRNLGYISSGQVIKIGKGNNLHYGEARTKLKKIPNARLLDIMKKLSYDFNPENIEEMLPSFWEPHEYFSIKKNQNLWSRAV